VTFFSATWQKRIAPGLMRVRPLSVRTETPEGGVVVWGGAKSLMTNQLLPHSVEQCRTGPWTDEKTA